MFLEPFLPNSVTDSAKETSDFNLHITLDFAAALLPLVVTLLGQRQGHQRGGLALLLSHLLPLSHIVCVPCSSRSSGREARC